jgi:TP901 family phage tail tape measure protein
MALAGYLPPIIAEVVSEVGKFSAGMGEVKAEMSSLEAANTKFAAAGKVAAVGLGIAIAGVGFESVKLASSFDQTMELIHTQAGASQTEVEGLKASVLALAPAVGIGPEKLAEGLYHIESTGYRGKQAMDILAASAHDAALGLTDMDTMSNALAGTLSVGMKDITSAADAANFLNVTVGIGDMRMEKLAAAIGTGVLPMFKSAGLGMIDFSAALATLTDNAVPADEAATRLKMTISLMAAPHGPAVAALKELGLSQFALAMDLRKPNGLLVATEDLKAHLGALDTDAEKVAANQSLSRIFGGGKTASAMMTLIEETDRLKSKYDAVGTSASRAAQADEAWAQQQKQFSQQWHEFVAQIQVVGIKIGNWLIPMLQTAAEWMGKNGETVKIAAIAIGSVLVVAITAATTAWIANAIAEAAALWWLYLIVAAVAAIGVGIYELVTHWTTVWNWIKRIAGDVWAWLVGAWHATINALEVAAIWVKTKIIDPIAHWFDQYFLRPIKAIIGFFVWEWKFAWGFLSVIIDDFKQHWAVMWLGITVIAKAAWDNILKPTFDFIDRYGIKPTEAAISWLVTQWGIGWDRLKNAAKWAWDNVLHPTFDAVDKYGISPIKAAIDAFGKFWAWVWDGVKAVVSAVWTFIKPILDRIGAAVGDVKKAIGGIINAPGQAGAALAHFLGFADGGVVPGPQGAPQLAVVHGGEQILSNDQLASMGRARPLVAAGVGGTGGGSGSGDILLQARFVMPDGKAMRTETLRYARQSGISPAKLYPASVRAI